MDTESDDIQFLTTRAPIVYVDIQGFREYRHRFIVKEFCLLDDEDIFHAIVKSPYSFKTLKEYYRRQAEWVTRFCHGLTFDCGDITIDQLCEQVYPRIKDKCIIVKGPQKIQWLKYIFRKCGDIQVCDVDEVGEIPNECSGKIYDICNYHNELFGWKPCRCALATVLKLKEYII